MRKTISMNIIIILLFVVLSISVSCIYTQWVEPNHNIQCIDSDNYNTDIYVQQQYNNSNIGEYNICIILHTEPYPDYSVSLSLSECNLHTHTHTLQDTDQQIVYFDLENTNTDCSRVSLNFSAKYLFAGCYTIQVIPRRNVSSARPEVHHIKIENNFTAADFYVHRPVFKITNEENGVELWWGFNKTDLFEDELRYTVEITTDDTSIDITDTCRKLSNDFVCKYEGLAVGNYSAEFKLYDFWRFSSLTHKIFGETFHWSRDFQRLSPVKFNGLYAQESIHISNWLDVILILSVILFSALFLLWIRRRIALRKTKNSKSAKQMTELIVQAGNIDNILLIYARDHELFMDAMVEFRKLLSKVTDCNVIDLFDYDCFNKFATAPQEYIRNLIINSNTICIIVENECADMILQTVKSKLSDEEMKLSDIYRESHCMDHFVLYALKLISYDIFSPSYQKYYVVRLSGFKGCEYLKDLNPFTRYEIPSSLEILIDNVTRQAQISQLSSYKCKLYDLSKSFNEKLAEFQSFVLENPNYLSTHILKEKSVI